MSNYNDDETNPDSEKNSRRTFMSGLAGIGAGVLAYSTTLKAEEPTNEASHIIVVDGEPTTNDRDILRDALIAHKNIHIPANTTCYIHSNLEIPSDGCRITGDGFTSIIKFSGDKRRIHVNVNNFTLENILIDGDKADVGWEDSENDADYGARVGEAVENPISGFRFLNVKFKNIGRDGIRLENCSDVLIDDYCIFENCRRWGVTIIPTAFHPMDNIKVGGYFDCSIDSGPSHKKYPLGAIDTEPNSPEAGTSIQKVTNIRYNNIYSKMGEVAIADKDLNHLDVIMSNVHVENAFLRVYNDKFSLNDITISGNKGYLRADIPDYIATEIRDLSVRFVDTGRTETRLQNGRQNLLRADYGEASALGITLNTSGDGEILEKIQHNVDGHGIYLTHMRLNSPTGSGSGSCMLTQTIDANINIGDQVFLYLEIDRIDDNVQNPEIDHAFKVTLGRDNTKIIDNSDGKILPHDMDTKNTDQAVPHTITRMIIATNATSDVVFFQESLHHLMY